METKNTNSVEITDETLSEYPQHITPLESQVAGHSFKDGYLTVGMLRDEEGYVLKPVNKPEQGKREILFYETLAESTDSGLVQLRQFVPQYFGSLTLNISGRSTTFLKLKDATRGYRKPCVMDVKIGKQTWEPDAPLKKQLNEEAKYTQCKQQCGFCIPGFQVYNVLSETVEKYGKDFGKTLTKDNIPNVLKKFLNYENGKSKAVGEVLLQQLQKILDWWRTQCSFHIYSSSVLLTYDAEVMRTTGDNNILAQALLIDFAHVIPANILDSNYLNGLENFVDLFSSVVEEL